MQKERNQQEMLEDFIAAYHYLKNHDNCDGNVGVVGFCFGGYISNMMATRIPDLAAAVPYYGGQPSKKDAAKIKSPLLLQYASLDKRVNAGWPEFETVLKENEIEHEAHFYDDVNHGFHNNTTPRYDKAAADLSWERTLAFFEKHLK
jgi:carboxymethylenebutenolidase